MTQTPGINIVEAEGPQQEADTEGTRGLPLFSCIVS